MKLSQLLAMSPNKLDAWAKTRHAPSRAEREAMESTEAFDLVSEAIDQYPIRTGRCGHVCVAD